MTPQTRSAASHAGFSDNAAGALAYVLLIPAILFLLVEPYNRNSYIRFHSWQCIYLAIACAAADCVLFLFDRIFFIPVAVVDVLYSLLHLAVLAVWIMLMMKALNGERYELPFIGRFAAWRAES